MEAKSQISWLPFSINNTFFGEITSLPPNLTLNHPLSFQLTQIPDQVVVSSPELPSSFQTNSYNPNPEVALNNFTNIILAWHQWTQSTHQRPEDEKNKDYMRKLVRVRGIEPPASRTPCERSTDELHPEN